MKQQVKQQDVHLGWAKDILRTLIKEDYRLYSVREERLNTVSKLGISKGSEGVVSSSGVLTNFVYAYGQSIIKELFFGKSLKNSKGQIDAQFTSLVRFFSVIPRTRGKSEIDKRGLLDHVADLDRDSAILFTSGETIKLQVLRNGQLETEEAAGPIVIVEVPGKVERSESAGEKIDKARLIGAIYRNQNGVRRFEVLKWLDGKKLEIQVLPLVDFGFTRARNMRLRPARP